MLNLSRSTQRIATFFAKVVAIYAIWYGIYDLWLLPDGRLDQWTSHSVAQVGSTVLNVLGFEAASAGRTLSLPGSAGIQIIDGCNGLGSFGLFVGFVLAFPGRHSRRGLFIPFGLLVIYLSNVARVTFLLLFLRYWESGFDLVHGFGAPAFFYLIVFGLWMLWANYGGETTKSSPVAKSTDTVQS